MKCKYCGKDIQFFKVPSGAKMPVETEKIFYKDKGKGRDRLAIENEIRIHIGRGKKMSKCVICKSSTKGNEEFCEDCQRSVEMALEDLFYGFVESFNAPEIKVVTLMREAFEKWNIATVDSILKEAVLREESEE